MKRTEVAYFAGLFDGEGTFSIQVRPRYSSSGKRSVLINPRATMTLKYGNEVLDRARELFGGSVYRYGYGDGSARWSVHNVAGAMSLATLFLPYLRVKKVTAQRFLEALRMFPKKRKCHCVGQRTWTKELTDKVAYIALTLNAGGSGKSKKTLAYLKELRTVYDET